MFMLSEIKAKLLELGFKNNEVKVFIALTQLGEAPASKVAKKVDLPRTTVISILDKLVGDNYVSGHKYRGVTSYWIESPRMLQQSLENKMLIASDLGDLLKDLYHTEADFPSAEVYDSKLGIKKYIEKLLFKIKKGTTIYTIDTPGSGNYEKIFSRDFGKTLIAMKNKKNVATKTLIPAGSFTLIDDEKLSSQHIELRELPQSVDFRASFWIIDDIVVLFSGKYPFIVATQHKIIAESLKSIFNFFWVAGERKH